MDRSGRPFSKPKVFLRHNFSLIAALAALLSLTGSGPDPTARGFPLFVLFGGLAGGFLMFFLGVARTRATLAERIREIRKSEEDHRQLVELSPDAVLVQSEGIVTFVNAAFVRLFKGSADKDFIGKRVLDLIHPDYHELVKKRIDEMKKGKNAPLMEERWQALGGDFVSVEVTAAPLSGEGRFSAQVIIRDVSERKRLERQLLQLQKMETVGTLAGGVAHDLNNQLTPVKGYIDLVLQSADPKSELYQQLTEANLAADRCREVIQRLLVFSRVSKEEKVILSIENLLNELRSLLKNFLPSTIETEVRFDKEIWPVQGNATELLTVLMNLATNARDAIEGGGKLAFEAENVEMQGDEKLEHKKGPYVLISAKDDGSGMSPELMKRIFEPFFTTKEKGKGTGLGLAMVYQIVKDHQGWIDVSSQPGHGTCFQIYLPAQSGKTASDKKLEILSADMMGRGETVLFAEDEETIRTLAAYFLARLGYKTIMADDGRKLVELYKQNEKDIDIVLLDATMPKLTARQALQELFAIHPNLKVIVTSGYTSEGAAGEFLELGVSSYLQKPYTITTMAKALRQALTQD